MTDLITPDMIVAELRAVRALADKGSEAIYAAEMNFDAASAEWQEAYDLAYSLAEGKTVADREIQARLVTRTQKLSLDIAKAELNRIKAKIRQLDSAQSNLQTQYKAIAITYSEAGR